MNNKTLAIVSYITLIGWIISFIQYRGKEEKSPLVGYHLEQALGILIFGLLLGIAVGIVGSIIPSLASILSLVTFVPLILLVFGIITAANEARKPVPLIGSFFVGKFNF